MPVNTKDDSKNKELLAKLAELGGQLTSEDDVTFRGDKIVLPVTLTLTDTVEFLQMKIREDEQIVTFDKVFEFRPWDGARAAGYALREAFGMMRQVPIMTMFGPQPPELKTIPTGPFSEEQVPWGDVVVPLLPGCTLNLGLTEHPELGMLFKMIASGPRKYRFQVEGIFRMVAEELRSNSMYRGQAFDGQETPEFMDLSGVDPDKVIYSEEVMTQLNANVWSLIRYPEQLKTLGVPMKRAALLEGPYGTGKTLAAYLTAQEAVKNAWTFVYCRPGRDDLHSVMATARLYQPAVVFFEDIDTAGNGNSDEVSRLLDLFDGINAKGTQIIAVLTTNHADRINKGMVRPGRLDAVIHIGELDDAGIKRLVEATVPGRILSPDLDWVKICEAMRGYLPAFAREAIDRAVRYNISRNNGVATLLETPDFVDAAVGLRPQLELMEGAAEAKDKPTLDSVFAGLFNGGTEEGARRAVHGAKVVSDGEIIGTVIKRR